MAGGAKRIVFSVFALFCYHDAIAGKQPPFVCVYVSQSVSGTRPAKYFFRNDSQRIYQQVNIVLASGFDDFHSRVLRYFPYMEYAVRIDATLCFFILRNGIALFDFPVV
jgi:hypothetical protein